MRRMNSARLHGLHFGMRHILVQIDPSDHGQAMSQSEPHEQPVLEHGSQLALAVPEGVREGDHTRTNRDGARVGAVFELLEFGPVESAIDVFAKDILSVHIYLSRLMVPPPASAAWAAAR